MLGSNVAFHPNPYIAELFFNENGSLRMGYLFQMNSDMFHTLQKNAAITFESHVNNN
jgi:hypothetical protein